MIHQRKIIKAIAYAILLCFTSLTGAQPLYAIPANTQLPTLDPNVAPIGATVPGTNEITGNTMNIQQTAETSIIKWQDFSIGADATVNFNYNGEGGFNSLNYVMNGPVSEIYGQLTALGGNIFIANPAGVQIGNSAQINVGSLYVTNKDVGSVLTEKDNYTLDDITSAINSAKVADTNAELMSLGSIISTNNNVTFDGNRIVIDTERLYTNEDGTKMRGLDEKGVSSGNTNDIGGLTIKTDNTNDVILGYDGTKDEDGNTIITGDISFKLGDESTPFGNTDTTTYHGYQWIRDLFQLQDIANTESLDGWYSLRNSIDASYTANENYKSGIDGDTRQNGGGFKPIGSNANRFTGRFDGLGYDIFGLNINRASETYIGLFGYVGNDSRDNRAYVRNFTLNSGSIIGNSTVGAAIGLATDGTVIENITNTTDVKGTVNVGGIIGTITGSPAFDQNPTELNDLINVGTVEGMMSVGGIAGQTTYASIGGKTYNLGNVIGTYGGENSGVGGIVGTANNSIIGNEVTNDGSGFQIYNQSSVTGQYNVGGIVGLLQSTIDSDGNMGTSEVRNVANHGTVTANGKTTDSYSYHTAEKIVSNIDGEVEKNNEGEDKYNKLENGLVTVAVDAANVGGIVGNSRNGTSSNDNERHITIKNVLNDGDVKTETDTENDGNNKPHNYYIAGNVGGVVGRADDTAIENATNRENSVAGAHNVGGIAGLLTGKSHVKDSTNDGGDITGTGARYTVSKDGKETVEVLKELVRPKTNSSDESFIVGNIGGIVGYMYDDDSKRSEKDGKEYTSAGAFIENSTNRGTVHSAEIPKDLIGAADNTLTAGMKAANVGGIAGKVDMAHRQDMELDVKPSKTNTASGVDDYQSVSIRHSYNTGKVQGYTGVGGVAGMMYNGSVARSFNTGNILSSRQSANDSKAPLNMGGVVGDTTELVGADGQKIGEAGTMIYDVYNAGQIGDETYTYYGRHVGGVVGRLTGEIDKAYNTGDIYNGFNVVGGVVGWWYDGNIRNVFNTGNITVVNNNTLAGSYVGGIVGNADAESSARELSYAYNLGTIRSFKPKWNNKQNYISGILGGIEAYSGNSNNIKEISINNVYTLGNLYAAVEETTGYQQNNAGLSAIWNEGEIGNARISNIENAVYISPEDKSIFKDLDVDTANGVTKINDYDQKNEKNNYGGMAEQIYDASKSGVLDGIPEPGDDNFEGYYWRIYDGTPILNVFLPYAEDLFSGDAVDDAGNKIDFSLPDGVGSVQYGTAYNPLMTIIKFNEGYNGDNLTLDWGQLKTTGTAGLAVYNNGLTLNNFDNNHGRYFGGTIYADGNLTINAATGEGYDGTQFVMSDGAKFYGSSVTVDTQGRNALISGHIEATGSKSDGGDVKVTSGKEGTNKANIEILGQLFSAAKGGTGHSVTVAGVSDAPREGWDISKYNSIIQDPKSHLTGVGILPTADEVYATVVNSSAADPGKVDVTTGGDVSIRYGNMGVGEIRSYGAFSVTASDIYLDSYMTLEDDMNLKSIDGGEILLDFTDAYYDEGTDEETQESLEHIHKVFLTHFRDKDATHDGDGAQINVIGTDKFNIMVDMWGELKDEDGNVQTDEQDNPMYGFDLTKYDYQDEGDTEKHSFAEDLLKLKINFGEKDEENFADFAKIRDLVHIWIEDAEQLAGIQKYYDDHDDTNILSYNFALKNNIDASVLDSFTSIGGEEGYSGTFDGRGFRILGLNVGSAEENDAVDNAGIFTKLIVDKDGHKGTVQDLRVYSSNFYGTNAAGAIAGVNEGGVISVVTTLGNHVEATGKDGADTGVQDVRGAAGGIVGINKGEIKGSDASDVVVAGGTDVTAGGVAGVNAEGGLIGAKANGGGDFEIEEGKTAEDYLVTADSAVTANKQGIFSIGGAVGVNKGEANLLNSTGVTNGRSGTDAYNVDKNVGGVVGLNDGDMTSLYNESIVMGKDNVGGVAGTNEGNMSNAVNATSVTADDKVDEDDKTAGNIGGLAGVNSGTIDSGRNAGVVTGGQNVGGLVGANNSSDKGEKTGILKNLSNALAAVINGKKFVGGIAGSNSGTITGESNLINEGAITGVQFVGGIAGQNSGEIRGGNAEDQRLTNKASINGTQYVGGIAGQNTGTIENTNAESKINAVDGKLDHESENLEKQFFGGVTGENIGIIDNATNTANLRIEGGKFVGGITGRNSKIIGDDGEITTEGVFKGKLVNKGAVYGDANVGGIAGMNQADNVLVGTKEEKLIVSNENTVEAENGGAAGIFHTNSGRIEYAEISNSGKIIGNESDGSGGENTGALFGVNTGSITNSTLKNSGEVTGGKNTGGLIGTNTGNITYSSLINEVGAKVTGTENVGGLIGYNIGMIEGGRKNAAGEDLGLYTYEIYNNGTVSGSANVGGLIGNNAVEGDKTGSLTAGYNTGVVSVTENSEGKNVGGIVGVNAGTIDQVFNTVMTLDENGKVVDGAISGVTNVGGIVGSNTGTLTNAYNTTDVESSGTKGNIAGENSGTVENVYATNDSGTLFGKITSTVAEAIKNAYSFSDDDNDKTKQGITFIAGNGRNNKNSYGGFSISGKADEETTWRIYEGYNTPLLKVFLTDASYSGDSEFVYNASQQGINDPSKITAADERQAFDNVNSLLQNLTQKNAGTYSVWSSQIAGHTYNDV